MIPSLLVQVYSMLVASIMTTRTTHAFVVTHDGVRIRTCHVNGRYIPGRCHRRISPHSRNTMRLHTVDQRFDGDHKEMAARSEHPISLRQKIANSLSQTAAMKAHAPYYAVPDNRLEMNRWTLARILIPSLLGGLTAFVCFPALALWLAKVFGSTNDSGVLTVLSTDSSQFVQNFLTVSSLLFSILVGQTWYFMYQQTEMIFYALFNEVTEAKSLLEQIALVCSGRSMYGRCLDSMSRYVRDDLKKLQADPAVLLSTRPVDDPLETIMFLTSVGVPSSVYETVRSLRMARAQRLGALQRKLPRAHMWLLWILAYLELVSFPLLGAGTQTIGGYKVLTVEGVLFGVMTFGIIMVLKVVSELWRPAGGAYNVDAVLAVMVRGLEDELHARMSNQRVLKSNEAAPSLPRERSYDNVVANTKADGRAAPSSSSQQKQQQGANVFMAAHSAYGWVRRRLREGVPR